MRQKIKKSADHHKLRCRVGIKEKGAFGIDVLSHFRERVLRSYRKDSFQAGDRLGSSRREQLNSRGTLSFRNALIR